MENEIEDERNEFFYQYAMLFSVIFSFQLLYLKTSNKFNIGKYKKTNSIDNIRPLLCNK